MLYRICCCLLLAFFSMGPATAQRAKDDSQETKLLVMEHLWNEAQLNHDSRALDGLIGANFINTEYDGEVSDKAKFLSDIKDPQFKPTNLTIQDLKVSMYGDSAVVAGIYHTKGTYQGQTLRALRPLHRHVGIHRRPLAVRRQPYQPAEKIATIQVN